MSIFPRAFGDRMIVKGTKSKVVCIKCINVDNKTLWDENDEIAWRQGVVFCPRSLTGRSIHKLPGKGCLYYLEHLALGEYDD